jgi:hypothetical protein
VFLSCCIASLLCFVGTFWCLLLCFVGGRQHSLAMFYWCSMALFYCVLLVFVNVPLLCFVGAHSVLLVVVNISLLCFIGVY